MTKNRAFRALNYIGADLIERSERPEQSELSRRSRAGLWTKSVAIAASVAVVVSGGVYLGVRNWNSGGKVDTPSEPEGIRHGYSELNVGPYKAGGEHEIAYETETSVFPIDSVQITVSFGWSGFDNGGPVGNYEFYSKTHEYSKVVLRFNDVDIEVSPSRTTVAGKYVLREVDPEEFKTMDYHVYSNFNELIEEARKENYINKPREVIYQFNHSEMFNIPREVFDNEMGQIVLILETDCTHYYDDNIRPSNELAIEALYYRVEGNLVYLYDNDDFIREARETAEPQLPYGCTDDISINEGEES